MFSERLQNWFWNLVGLNVACVGFAALMLAAAHAMSFLGMMGPGTSNAIASIGITPMLISFSLLSGGVVLAAIFILFAEVLYGLLRGVGKLIHVIRR